MREHTTTAFLSRDNYQKSCLGFTRLSKTFILHIIHILGKRMKASGVDGLSNGDLTEGVMSGQDTLSFIPFHLGSDEQSNGQTGDWVQSWWHSKNGTDFGGLPLREVTKDNMFEVQDFKATRL